jgi:hypothetical protein
MMRVWPLEIGMRVPASNYPKLLWLRVMVVSVAGKGETELVKYVDRR